MAAAKASAPVPVDSPLDIARKKIFLQRVEAEHKRINELKKIYTDRLNSYLDTYFGAFSDVPSENEFSYNELNKSWKEYSQKANMSQKLMSLRSNAFEVEVAQIIEKNPKYKQEKTAE